MDNQKHDDAHDQNGQNHQAVSQVQQTGQGSQHVNQATQTHGNHQAKEYEPLPKPDSGIRPAEHRHTLDKELKDAGVKEVEDHLSVELKKEQLKAGVEPAKEAVPVKVNPSGIVNLPISEVRAIQIVKTHKKVKDSIYWLAYLVVRQIKKAHSKAFRREL